MEFKINASPHLNMSEITKQLFNRNFHADVQFIVEGQIIYAHSLELIKRSVVFEQQLQDTMGDTKLIPINDCKYESFLEFVRYIYTDECMINIHNFVDILKLATKYQFIKLENQVIDSSLYLPEWRLKLFEHCVLHKYEVARNFINIRSAYSYNIDLEHEQFLSLHPDAVDAFLKFERVPESVTEMQIFTSLAKWIKSYCKMHQITLAEGRQRWDKLIRKIRFPAMTNEELRVCSKNYPGLFSKSDRMSISSQAVFGDSDSVYGLWICKGREKFIWPLEYRKFKLGAEHQTVFSVFKATILHGIRIGIEETNKPIEIEISGTGDKSRARQKLKFLLKNHLWRGQIINLGYSIRLKPNFNYTIKIKFLDVIGNYNVLCRNAVTNVIINDPGKTINLIRVSSNMIEMFFKPATD